MKSDYDCSAIEFQRKMDENGSEAEQLYTIVRDTFIDLGVVFFGGYAASLYSRQMPKKNRQFIKKIPDFDVLSNNPQPASTDPNTRPQSTRVYYYIFHLICTIVTLHVFGWTIIF